MFAGSLFGPYQVTALLGEGAMGQVFLGKDTNLNRDVALKILRPEISQRSDLLERFRNEAAILAKLHHGNICSVYAFIEHQGHSAIVLQYLEGSLLQNALREHGSFSWQETVRITKQILSGLIEAHTHEVIHRDLKPANLMITTSGRVVIMDFGIARLRNQQRLTQEGMMLGTLEYASAEQIRGEDVDARSDLYSLGIIVFEMLTGKLPFDAKTEYEWMCAQTQQQIDLTEIQKKFGKNVAHFIKTATEKEPSKRFASAHLMLESLEAISIPSPSKSNGNQLAMVGERIKNHKLVIVYSFFIAIGLVFLGLTFTSTTNEAPLESTSAQTESMPSQPSLTATPEHNSAPVSAADIEKPSKPEELTSTTADNTPQQHAPQQEKKTANNKEPANKTRDKQEPSGWKAYSGIKEDH